ncbi:MAG: SpoIIE family protein phosphatase [Candidatus Riflebacteria bacterium]|nr:SpoIIE family protein phosphatase [Candidatus Riflebacteria bacterium]
MTFPAFLGICAIIVQATLAMVVMLKDPGRTQNRLFSLQLLLFCFWSGAELYLLYGGVSLTGIKLLFTPAILLAYVFCIFTAIYPENQPDASIIKNRTYLAVFFLPAAALLFFLWTGRLISGFEPIAAGFSIDLGRFEFVVKGVVIGYLFLSLSTLSSSRKKADTTIQLRRLRYTFAAMLLPVAAGSIVIAFSKWFIGGTTMYSFGLFPVLSIIMSIILGYTMLRYNLMEIDLIFSTGLVYTLLTAIMAGIMELFQELMQNILNFSDLWSKIIAILIIAGIFSPVKELLIQLVDKFFGRQTFDSATVMQTILGELRKMPDEKKLFERFLSELGLVLDFSGARLQLAGQPQLVVPAELQNCTIREEFSKLPPDINDIDSIIQYYINSNSNDLATAARELKDCDVRHLFNFADNERQYGFLLLSAKNTRVPYTTTEINLLLGLVNEVPHLLANLSMIDRLINQEKISQEIDWARKMLQAISASGSISSFSGMPIASFASLSTEIKGDMIDICQNQDNSFIGIYDAFHHGIQAVLTLNIMFAVLRCFSDMQSQLHHANRVLRCFSQQLCSAATIIKVNQRKIEIANVGNPSPLVISAAGIRRLFDDQSQPVGYHEEIRPQFCSFELADNELLFCSTNGIYKAFKQLHGQTLEEFLQSTGSNAIEQLHQKIINSIKTLTHQNFTDDITFLMAGQI